METAGQAYSVCRSSGITHESVKALNSLPDIEFCRQAMKKELSHGRYDYDFGHTKHDQL
jgi:hypothetical protein